MVDLRDNLEAIRDETTVGANTAKRVGGAMVDMYDYFSDRSGYKHEVMNEGEFNALEEKKEDTIYLITEE